MEETQNNQTGTVETQNMDKKEDVLEVLLKKTKKQLFYTRIIAFSCVLLFLTLFVAVLIVVPKVNDALREVTFIVSQAEGTLDAADEALENISEMSVEVTCVSTELHTFIGENTETLSGALQDISDIDFDGLNKAIQDLQDAVGPFANFMNGFRR